MRNWALLAAQGQGRIQVLSWSCPEIRRRATHPFPRCSLLRTGLHTSHHRWRLGTKAQVPGREGRLLSYGTTPAASLTGSCASAYLLFHLPTRKPHSCDCRATWRGREEGQDEGSQVLQGLQTPLGCTLSQILMVTGVGTNNLGMNREHFQTELSSPNEAMACHGSLL
jgi:hypothetical protein